MGVNERNVDRSSTFSHVHGNSKLSRAVGKPSSFYLSIYLSVYLSIYIHIYIGKRKQ
jgi:hypothetical protein